MKQMKCEICGGTDIKKIEEGVFCCDSCGCKYTVEQAKSLLTEITGTVKIDGPVQVKGMQSADSLYKNGEVFLSIVEFEKAAAIFQKMADEYPDDYRGWWGLILAKTESLHNCRDLLNGECDCYFSRVEKFAPSEVLEQMKPLYQEAQETKRILQELTAYVRPKDAVQIAQLYEEVHDTLDILRYFYNYDNHTVMVFDAAGRPIPSQCVLQKELLCQEQCDITKKLQMLKKCTFVKLTELKPQPHTKLKMPSSMKREDDYLKKFMQICGSLVASLLLALIFKSIIFPLCLLLIWGENIFRTRVSIQNKTKDIQEFRAKYDSDFNKLTDAFNQCVETLQKQQARKIVIPTVSKYLDEYPNQFETDEEYLITWKFAVDEENIMTWQTEENCEYETVEM